MWQKLLIWLTAAVCGAALTTYFVATFLYLTPPNPVKARHLGLLFRIEHPFFSQNWHLFAPNPVRSNLILTGRCRAGALTTPWRDLTTPLVAGLHRHRLSPVGKLLRPTQDAVYLLLGRTLDEWTPLVCRRFPADERCRKNAPRQRAKELGTFMVRRLVSASCADIPGVERVQARILVHDPPPWSRRHRPQQEGTVRFFTLPWMDYVRWP